MATTAHHLVVLVPDSLGELLTKGELQPRYYNPGNLFAQVTLITTSIDSGSKKELKHSMGSATFDVVSMPADYEIINHWRFPRVKQRLRRWADMHLQAIRDMRPSLIRCHGADWNSYLASRIKQSLGTPYVVSLHINPDVNPTRRPESNRESIIGRRTNRFYEYVERQGLQNADLVMPVYEPIIPYLQRMAVTSYRVHYNVLDRASLVPKDNYSVSPPARIVCVTRMIPEKSPLPILEALLQIPEVHLTLIGDGVLAPSVERAITEMGLSERVTWHRSLTNAELCQTLHTFDLFVIYTQFWELSKSLMEALLTGMPVILNQRNGEPVPELVDAAFVCWCGGDAIGYAGAIRFLLANKAERVRLGEAALAWARTHIDPATAEAAVVSTYQTLISRTSGMHGGVR